MTKRLCSCGMRLEVLYKCYMPLPFPAATSIFISLVKAYKTLSTTRPPYLYDLVSIQPPHGHNTCSSPYVTLIKPSSSLKVTHWSFRHASPHLWNQLPTSLRIPHPTYSSPLSDLHLNMPVKLATHCYHLPSLFHCSALISKPTFSENLILHLCLFLSVGLISWL